MSCNCHSVQIVLPPPSCPDTGVYTASNANLTGQGVFFQQNGNEFQFYGISNSDGYVDISLDAVNNAILVNLNAELVSGSIPDSTTTVKGKTAYSTDAQAQAKTVTTKALTPSNLAALASSTVFVGMTRFATEAETQSGSSSSIAVTPAGLQSVLNNLPVPEITANQPETETTTPLLAGQLLLQKNTATLYYAETAAEGDWELTGIPRIGAVSLLGDVQVTGANEIDFQCGSEFSGVMNFDVVGGNLLHRNGVVIPANSVLITSGTAGQLSYIAADQFVGQYATQSYTVGGIVTSRSITGAETLTDVINVLGTLITDLAATQKPQF